MSHEFLNRWEQCAKSAWPEVKTAFREALGKAASVVMDDKRQRDIRRLPTKFALGSHNLSVIVKSSEDMDEEQFVAGLREAAMWLGDRIARDYDLAKKASEKDHDLFWLENWPLTAVTACPEPQVFAVKLSIRGGWHWLSNAEMMDIYMGRRVARLENSGCMDR